jgi:hypothetical protein
MSAQWALDISIIDAIVYRYQKEYVVKQRNPLGKLELVIVALGCLVLLSLLVVVPTHLGQGDSIFGLSGPEVCAEAPFSALVEPDKATLNGGHVTDLARGVRAQASQFELCASSPTTRQRVLATLIDLPGLLFYGGFLFITWRLTRRGRLRGLFTLEVAAAVTRLSVYLFVGQFVVALAKALAAQHLVATMVTGPMTENSWLRYAHLSWVVIIAAFGLQAMGRVMAATVPMQAEIDATV